jgi:two-component system, cell cycle response regulator
VNEAARILVVDDAAMNRQILERLLLREGHVVLLAENGRLAMERLRQEPVDVVLLDLVMPEMDGLEVLTALKRDEALRHVPVIMVSAVEDIESVTRCIEVGAVDYLQKPFNRAILHARVAACLAEKRLRDTELEYLEQVGRVTEAAAALEAGVFDAATLDVVAAREDQLGQLGRVFQRMAAEVREREERLTRQVRELRLEVDHGRTSKQVAEITGTDYFKELRSQASELRGMLSVPE